MNLSRSARPSLPSTGFCLWRRMSKPQKKNVASTFFTGKRASWRGHETADLQNAPKSVSGSLTPSTSTVNPPIAIKYNRVMSGFTVFL